jgi:hypothetical protein
MIQFLAFIAFCGPIGFFIWRTFNMAEPSGNRHDSPGNF